MGADLLFLFRVKNPAAFARYARARNIEDDFEGKPLQVDPQGDDERITGRLRDGSILIFSGMDWSDFGHPYDAQQIVFDELGPEIAEHVEDPRGVFVFPDVLAPQRGSMDSILEEVMRPNPFDNEPRGMFVPVATRVPKPDRRQVMFAWPKSVAWPPAGGAETNELGLLAELADRTRLVCFRDQYETMGQPLEKIDSEANLTGFLCPGPEDEQKKLAPMEIPVCERQRWQRLASEERPRDLREWLAFVSAGGNHLLAVPRSWSESRRARMMARKQRSQNFRQRLVRTSGGAPVVDSPELMKRMEAKALEFMQKRNAKQHDGEDDS